QIYLRCKNIEGIYSEIIKAGISIHPAGSLQIKPWGMKEFALLDPDKNLLTFGEEIPGNS
ncbi:MAG: VOC family protein, partial [Bacteroidetes bacterium]|nr:VOC family protein [Bacteroidota bacterium]